ncbi:MAG: hypothetical protein WAX66_03955 [Patescibacteria group bacterium]
MKKVLIYVCSCHSWVDIVRDTFSRADPSVMFITFNHFDLAEEGLKRLVSGENNVTLLVDCCVENADINPTEDGTAWAVKMKAEYRLSLKVAVLLLDNLFCGLEFFTKENFSENREKLVAFVAK